MHENRTGHFLAIIALSLLAPVGAAQHRYGRWRAVRSTPSHP